MPKQEYQYQCWQLLVQDRMPQRMVHRFSGIFIELPVSRSDFALKENGLRCADAGAVKQCPSVVVIGLERFGHLVETGMWKWKDECIDVSAGKFHDVGLVELVAGQEVGAEEQVDRFFW